MEYAFIAIVVSLRTTFTGRRHDHSTPTRRMRGDHGQATTEYALVLLAGALVALMVIAWATAGGGAARIAELFGSVIDRVIGEV